MQQKRSVKRRAKSTGSTKKASRAKSKRTKPAAKTQQAKPTLQFRQRVPEDDAFILKLTEDQLGQVHQEAFGEAFPREQFMYYIQSGAPVTVFEAKGEKIGYYSYLVGHDGKMHISALVIDPAYQAKGIGTTVMKHLEEEALRRGVQLLEVFVQTNNEKSIEFTKQLGFTEAFRIPPNTISFQKRIQIQAARHSL